MIATEMPRMPMMLIRWWDQKH